MPAPVEGVDERAQRKLDLATWDANSVLAQPEEYFPAATEAAALEKAQKLAARKEEKPLWGCVQRWTNEEAAKNKDAIVVVASHANGFHKETYEPVFETLLKKSKVPFAELWAVDTSHAGYAGFLNRGRLGWAGERGSISAKRIMADTHLLIWFTCSFLDGHWSRLALLASTHPGSRRRSLGLTQLACFARLRNSSSSGRRT